MVQLYLQGATDSFSACEWFSQETVVALQKETLLSENGDASVERACRKLLPSFSHALIELNDDKTLNDPTVTLETPMIQLS